MTQAVKRACDACHRRKVKCDGVNPCRNCHTAQLSCTYNAIPQKKGPKGSRAKVISELRETQRQTSLSAKVQNRMNGIPNPPGPVSLAPTPGLLSSELVKECIDFYFANLYEKMPILDRRQIDLQLPYMEQNRDTYCLMMSLCAFMMLQPGMSMPTGDPYNLDVMPGATIVASQLLLDETLQVRKGYDYLDNLSFNTLATNFFIYGCYHGLELHDKAWFYLREASTMMHLNGMSKEETYHGPQWENAESSRRRRLYWLFYIMERAHAIQRLRPLTLQATINPPNSADDPSDPLSHQLNSFIMLVNLFRPFDDAFTTVWNKTRTNLYVANLQKQLNEVLPTYLCQDGQLSDLRTNQQWLKSTVWQLTHGNMNSQNEDNMNFNYPVDLSRELLMTLASHFPGQGMELMGSGLIEKLFEISCNMTDFLAVQPAARDPFTVGPREQLNQTLNIVAVLRHGDHRFLPLLLNKVAEIMPRLTNPMLQNAPENSNLGNIDIFDGFGNAGMAQPPPQMQMQMDTEYERKFSAADYDKKYGMSDMNSNGSDTNTIAASSTGAPSVPPATTADMNSPFASSPAIMSPPMEYPHNGMNDYGCTPMPDMVMSPMGQNGSAINGSSSISNQHQQQQPHHLIQNQCMTPQQMQPSMNQHHNHNMQQGNISPPSIQGQQSLASASIPTSHPMGPGGNNLMNSIPRQQPQRASSYAIQQQPIPRTVGDFHALQRANSDMPGLSGISTEMDFNTLR
ncbi:putative sucrose utilization protein SUC1 [Colletotrichum spaethianum]|uniref:Sucrose utilization protein SUC1 n=1 Tax=Colletotrichum spaethianum TaxID=700344 RepID=A0AA37LCG0_9PEZI|nr:putative sucrose utilization protein SUC1 [Colletotrichum spaethianum]GKT46091.1 putative sucrose utilization protein SUC1 [Colletotrichum spaethianum]